MRQTIGIDFGTTNTVAARKTAGSDPVTVKASGNDSFPSLVCFYEEQDGHRKVLRAAAGPAAFEAYVTHTPDCRLVRSFKNHLASRNIAETAILGRRFTVEQLVGAFLREFRKEAGPDLDPGEATVFAGRPVRFWGGDPDEELAVSRLRAAYALAGFDALEFVNESLGAAYFHVAREPGEKVCLVADLGGGTSDFSLIRVTAAEPDIEVEPLGQGGIGIAGDTLDYRIVQNVVSPVLGQGTYFQSFGKRLPVPKYIFSKFERWSEISSLRAHKTMRDLIAIRDGSEYPERIDALIAIVENELSLELYNAVSRTKIALSAVDEAAFHFEADGVEIRRTVARDEFDGWIAGDVSKIEDCMLATLASARVTPAEVDYVFMTGGTSFVPLIRHRLERVFDPGKLIAGNEFVSVAAGLAVFGENRG